MGEMSANRSTTKWVCFDSNENEEFEEEEALSLCDLPTDEQETEAKFKKDRAGDDQETREKSGEEDFDFGSFCRSSVVPENQMCDADEVFFQGQILPLRHSVSSDGVLSTGLKNETRNLTRSVSESRSVISSRSSSIRSYNSTTSGSSTSTSNNNNIPKVPLKGYRPRIRNQFHSHPSPTPQIRTPSFRRLSHSNPKTSSLWSFLQVGVLKPQEIGLADLKNRSKRFGSHNSNSSSTSSSMNSAKDHQTNLNSEEKPKMTMKKKQRLFFGGCKCSVDAIEASFPSRILMVEVEKTNSKEKSKKKKQRTTMTEGRNNIEVGMVSDELGGSGGGPGKKEQGKQAVSRHRTFEWLKQLSIQERVEDDDYAN